MKWVVPTNLIPAQEMLYKELLDCKRTRVGRIQRAMCLQVISEGNTSGKVLTRGVALRKVGRCRYSVQAHGTQIS